MMHLHDRKEADDVSIATFMNFWLLPPQWAEKFLSMPSFPDFEMNRTAAQKT